MDIIKTNESEILEQSLNSKEYYVLSDPILAFGSDPIIHPLVVKEDNVEVVRILSKYLTLTKERKISIIIDLLKWCEYEIENLK